MAEQADRTQRALSLRQQARQARRLVIDMQPEDSARALKFARELEERADTLVQEAAASGPPPSTVTQPQQQTQQQALTDPAEDRATDETKSFFGATLEAAKKEARDWMADQTDVVLVRERSEVQSQSGGWRVTVAFQRRRKPGRMVGEPERGLR